MLSEALRSWPKDHLAAYSTRIGAAHDLAASGIDLTSIMHSGGWNDPQDASVLHARAGGPGIRHGADDEGT